MKTNYYYSLVLAFFLTLSSAFAADRPNVILIITDDQGYGDMSAHGNPILKTPNMDRLRESAVRFTDFHVAPMCSPTRGQLLTGIDAMRNGCTTVNEGRSMMRSELPTMANFFADSGYSTGHFGKWHLGDSYPHRPQDRGFQETLHHRAWGITSLADYWGNTYFDPVLSRNGINTKYEGYCTDIFFSEAMKWIEEKQSEDEPFFVYLPTNTPHVPNVVAEKYSESYEGEYKGKPVPAEFYGMIANLDENVGKLEVFLEEKGLREDTILIYLSDNGTQSSQAQAIYNAGMRNKKTSVYEGGHRVPLFVRWPKGNLVHGNDIDELTQVQDILPTLIEFCGLRNATNAEFNGSSIAGLLDGSADKMPDRKLVVQYRSSGERWDPAVVMWNQWRLVSGKELYDVRQDKGQKKNLAEKRPEVFQAMSKHYDSWHKEAKALFDLPRWITIGSEKANPMILYGQDWVGDRSDNPKHLASATAKGYWNTIVDRDGVYEIELRRWLKESGKALAEGWEERPELGASARPVAAINLQVAGSNQTLDIGPTDTNATFYVRLPSGKTQIATMMMDRNDQALGSAIYMYLRRLDDVEASSIKLTPTSGRKPVVNSAARRNRK